MRWKIEEENLLKEIYKNNSKEFIISKLNKSWTTICRKARKLNLHRNPDLINEDRKKRGPRKDSWTTEEINILKNIYENNSKEFILSKFKNRSWQSIRSNAQKLNLQRNPEIIKQEMIDGGKSAPAREDFWSPKEDDLLKEVYEKNSMEFIMLYFENRTWKAIRERAIKLGLRRNRDKINEDIVKHNNETIKKRYGVEYSTQLNSMKEKSRQSNIEKRGVEYPSQSKEVKRKVKVTVQSRYGVDNVFQSPEIKKKITETNIERYGVENPQQNVEIKEKTYKTVKLNNSFSSSDEENNFFNYLIVFDPFVEHQVMHPIIKHVIDFYMPRYNLWVQYDGNYWHGKEIRENDTSPRALKIKENIKNDEIQNKNIPNLIRFWSDDVKEAIRKGIIIDLIKNKINSKNKTTFICHQYKKKLQWIDEDKKNIDFNHSSLKATSFTLSEEKFNNEMVQFIKKYEWLGTIGVIPKWCFTARYNNILAGVLFINEPTAYSKILGKDTPKYEALIQRGATASWTPKNLGSRLIRFACNWMANNTSKRAFIGYADPKALEIGTIYQACGFDYLGNNFGSSYLYKHPSIKNNRTFSAQSLKRTSAFKKWCKNQGIISQKEWFKENGFKNMSTIPEGIKVQWNNWNKNILSEAQKFITERKHKYVLLIGENKRDKKKINKLKNYVTKPYPKREKEIYNSKCIEDINIKQPTEKFTYLKEISKFSTKCRRTPEKTQYIITNYKNKTKKELSKALNETERWVKSQIKFLQKKGTLSTKNPIGCTKDRKTEEKLQFIIDNRGKMTRNQMAETLEETPRWIKRQIALLRKNNKI